MASPEQLKHFKELWVFVERVWLEYRGGAQRQQSHHRADLQSDGIPIREMQQIIEESVRLVPHLVFSAADVVHGVGNPDKMLQKPEGNFLVNRVVLRQDERHLEHAQAVERHPCGAVSLVQMSARW